LIDALFERGYTVVPAFFSSEELAVVRSDFEALRAGDEDVEGELTSELEFEDVRMRPIRDRLGALLQAVSDRRTGRRVLLPFTIGNYIRSTKVKYGFHCDYGGLSPSPDSFKVWIPIVKPDPAKDGMTFVRMDKFRIREPEVARKLAGRGAAAIQNGRELVLVGRTVERSELKASIDDLCETPETRPGDVVLFRAQDTFHRSQERTEGEARSERVAWAFPIRMASEVIGRRELFRQSEKKREFLGRRIPSLVLACSWYHRRDEITYEELQEFERHVREEKVGALTLFRAAYLVEPLHWRA
jgi:hypothetical protein